MSLADLADCPSRNTRSSQNTPAQSQEDARDANGPLYEITLAPYVKSSVNQRNSSSKELSTFVCGGESWSEIKSKIFLKYKSECLGIAQRHDDGSWSILEEEITEDDFSFVFNFRTGSHVKKLDDESRMHDWLVSVRHTKVFLFVYKYGNKSTTKERLSEFMSKCVAPTHQDRSGAATEATIQDYVAKLQARWSDIWQAEYPIWRLWANHIVKGAMLTWESRVQQGPPPNVLARLRPRISEHEVLNTELRRNIRTALDIIKGSETELEALVGAVDVVQQRLAMFKRFLPAKHDILDAMQMDIAPIPDSDIAANGLADIDNIRDVDHDFDNEDME